MHTFFHKKRFALPLTLCVLTLAIPAPFLLANPLHPKTIQYGEVEITARRLPDNPIISYKSSATLGTKINGPSVIQVPHWVTNSLGKYYLYFAHHDGSFIRLAYSDRIQGPWTVHEPGALDLKDSPAFIGHIASPDVHVDHESEEIRMYFHGSRENENQRTAVATSKDGIHFNASPSIIGSAYFRVFEYKNYYYAIDAHGFLNRSRFPDREWSIRETELIAPVFVDDEYGARSDVRIRHSAVWVKEDTLYLFFTRKADAPERILLCRIPLQGDWTGWEADQPVEILRPETEYEGISFPIQPSKKGGKINVQQLRDPAIFHDDNGKSYLFYSVAGEMGIAMAEISIGKRAP